MQSPRIRVPDKQYCLFPKARLKPIYYNSAAPFICGERNKESSPKTAKHKDTNLNKKKKQYAGVVQEHKNTTLKATLWRLFGLFFYQTLNDHNTHKSLKVNP